MVYKIENDYYVKVGGYFVKVDVIVNDDDINLKAKNEKIEINDTTSKIALTIDELKKEVSSKQEVKKVVEEDEVKEQLHEHIYEKRSSKYNR